MATWLRSRLGVAIMGAALVGVLAAVAGAGTTAWHPASQGLNGDAQVTETAHSTAGQPTATATTAPTATAQPTATDVPTAAPTSTPNPVGSTWNGTVVSVDASNNILVMSRNSVHYTILVDDATTYSGAATQLSAIQVGWRVSVTIAKQEDSGYLASHISSALPDN